GSVMVQGFSLYALRHHMRWRGSLVLIAGGAIGVVPALYLLHRIDARSFQIGFGAFLAAYSVYMLLRPAMARAAGGAHWLRDAAVGFGGGLVGGLTPMPGALPLISRALPRRPHD